MLYWKVERNDSIDLLLVQIIIILDWHRQGKMGRMESEICLPKDKYSQLWHNLRIKKEDIEGGELFGEVLLAIGSVHVGDIRIRLKGVLDLVFLI